MNKPGHDFNVMTDPLKVQSILSYPSVIPILSAICLIVEYFCNGRISISVRSHLSDPADHFVILDAKLLCHR